MPDSPDFSKYLPGSTRFSLQDMGELAARLGSPMTFDRRGEVVFMDDGSLGLAPWGSGWDGAGGAVEVTCYAGASSPYSIMLTPGTTLDKWARITHYATPKDVSRMGLEATLSFDSLFDEHRLYLRWYGGDFTNYSVLSLNAADQTLDLLNELNVMVPVADIPVSFWAGTLHHTIKFVVDFSVQRYIRAVYDDLEIDLTGFQYLRAAAINKQGSYIELRQIGDGINPGQCFVGSVILTSNEP